MQASAGFDDRSFWSRDSTCEFLRSSVNGMIVSQYSIVFSVFCCALKR